MTPACQTTTSTEGWKKSVRFHTPVDSTSPAGPPSSRPQASDVSTAVRGRKKLALKSAQKGVIESGSSQPVRDASRAVATLIQQVALSEDTDDEDGDEPGEEENWDEELSDEGLVEIPRLPKKQKATVVATRSKQPSKVEDESDTEDEGMSVIPMHAPNLSNHSHRVQLQYRSH